MHWAGSSALYHERIELTEAVCVEEGQANSARHHEPSRALLALVQTTETSPQRAPNLARVVVAAHLRLRDVVAPSAPARAVAVHAKANAGR